MLSQTDNKLKSTRGASAQILGGVWQMLLRLGASVVLARILCPDDFGIMGMLLLISELFTLVGFAGYSSAVIAKHDLNDTDLNTAFWMSTATGLILYIVIFMAATLLERFLCAPGLEKALHIGSVVILFTAMSNTSTALLTRDLRFRTMSLISATGVAVEMGLAIVLAYSGLGFMSLILGWLIGEFLTAIARIFAAKWLPGITTSKNSYKFIFRYKSSQFLNSILVYLIMNTDRVVISWLLGPTTFGLYTFAIRLPSMVYSRLVAPASGVIFPMLVRMNYPQNSNMIFNTYVKAAKYLAIMSFPLLAGLAALAEPLVNVLWGNKWIQIVVPLQILCASYAVSCVCSSLGAVFLAANRPDVLPKSSLIKFFLSYLLVTSSCLLWGLNGAAFGYFLRVLLVGIDFYIAKRLFSASFIAFIKQLAPAFIASTSSGFTAFFFMAGADALNITKIYGLSLSIAAGIISFIIIMKYVFTSTFNEICSVAKIVYGE